MDQIARLAHAPRSRIGRSHRSYQYQEPLSGCGGRPRVFSDVTSKTLLWSGAVSRELVIRRREIRPADLELIRQLKYLVCWADRPVACLRFGPAAWKLASRDHYIGWSAQARQQRLAWVVNNDRCLILPGVRIPHLASGVRRRVKPSTWVSPSSSSARWQVRPASTT